MNLENVILFVIMALVLVVLPWFLAKKSGKNPMEIFFGGRVNNTPFVKKSGNEEKTAEGGKNQKTDKTAGKIQKNGTKSDLYQCISSLVSFSRRNHMMIIVPGTVQSGDRVAMLVAVLVTRSKVVGFNCFGYGGSVSAKPGDIPWVQRINGETNEIPSVTERNKEQEDILKEVLKEAGYPDLPCEVVGVFTAPGVKLSGASGTKCYTSEGVIAYLGSTPMLKDSGVDCSKVGKKLNEYVKRK